MDTPALADCTFQHTLSLRHTCNMAAEMREQEVWPRKTERNSKITSPPSNLLLPWTFNLPNHTYSLHRAVEIVEREEPATDIDLTLDVYILRRTMRMKYSL